MHIGISFIFIDLSVEINHLILLVQETTGAETGARRWYGLTVYCKITCGVGMQVMWVGEMNNNITGGWLSLGRMRIGFKSIGMGV